MEIFCQIDQTIEMLASSQNKKSEEHIQNLLNNNPLGDSRTRTKGINNPEEDHSSSNQRLRTGSTTAEESFKFSKDGKKKNLSKQAKKIEDTVPTIDLEDDNELYQPIFANKMGYKSNPRNPSK